MNEQEITKEKMDSLKALADINIKISEAKNNLFKLQNSETEYLKEREEKALLKIQSFLQESRDLFKEIKKNHNEVQDFSKTISETSNFLTEIHDKFIDMLAEFNQRSDEWDKEVENTKKELDELSKNMKIEAEIIKNDKKNNENTLKIIAKEKKHIASQQAQIKSALELLSNKK